MSSHLCVWSLLCASTLLVSHAAWPQGMTDMKPGQGGGPITGGAGTEGSTGAAPTLEKCGAPLGTIAVVEPQDLATKALLQYSLPSPTGLIRLMIQQSNCFMVVERGVAMQNMMQERALAEGGQLRGGSNMGQGQMVTADFVLTPDVVFSEKNAGGVGGALGAVGSLFGAGGAVLGAVAGGLKFKQAQTSMLVADTRTGVQVAAASGSAEKADWGVGGLLAGGGAAGALGAYENTAEGKVVAASFLDNYNQVVRSVRGNPGLQRTASTLKQEAANQPRARSAYDKGEILVPKISGVRIHAQPSEASKVVGTLSKNDEVISLGTEKDGFLNVRGSKGSGWVETMMLRQ